MRTPRIRGFIAFRLARWFQANVYPAEVPGLQAAVVGYLARMQTLADEPNDFAPVVSAQFLQERYDAVTIG